MTDEDYSSAMPCVSLVVVMDARLVGHILFTRVTLRNASRQLPASLLAPLAVLPEPQRKGIGSQLIEAGLRRLGSDGVELVFVLGYPDYYGRHGFLPAGRLGFDAPYPIPEAHADAWMVRELKASIAATVRGQVVCARALDKEEYWRE